MCTSHVMMDPVCVVRMRSGRRYSQQPKLSAVLMQLLQTLFHQLSFAQWPAVYANASVRSLQQKIVHSWLKSLRRDARPHFPCLWDARALEEDSMYVDLPYLVSNQIQAEVSMQLDWDWRYSTQTWAEMVQQTAHLCWECPEHHQAALLANTWHPSIGHHNLNQQAK